MKNSEEYLTELYDTIIRIQTAEDCKNFFDDLCTYKELEQMGQRVHAAKLFLGGRTYSEIIAETDISSTTLSRISRAIAHGSGGYKKFIAVADGEDNDNK